MPADVLSKIPVLDIPPGEEPAVVSALAQSAVLDRLLTRARRAYTPFVFVLADFISRLWSARSTSPYAGAVRSVDRAIGRRGAFLLNYSFEWGCTTGAVEDKALGGPTLLRTLDWPFRGLGRNLVVTRQQAEAGAYLSVTWPGFAGVLTGMAAGRFAAAINQPPLPLPFLGKSLGWLAARLKVSRSAALPPSHLLRLVFETCTSFHEAEALLRATPICLPAIFTLVGVEPGDTAVIERTETAAFEPTEPAAANHWASNPGPAGWPRNATSRKRRALMCEIMESAPGWSFGWLREPILRRDTVLAVMANPRTGRLLARGWASSAAVTKLLDLG